MCASFDLYSICGYHVETFFLDLYGDAISFDKTLGKYRPSAPQQVCVSRQRAKSNNDEYNQSAKGGQLDSTPRTVCVLGKKCADT